MDNLKYIIDIEHLNIHVEDSYLIKSKQQIREALDIIMQDSKYAELYDAGFSRTKGSMVQEWAAHNVLYRWGIKKSGTKDVDLDQNETSLRKLGYAFLSAFCK